ncbi:MAG TPA: ATP-binding cassette domain-containing protein, partial [Candidatus Omnitrophota bacterium]|nr:ATP-binding cassette domain-containing protein [Candidatus Omnitrophota bacterium]
MNNQQKSDPMLEAENLHKIYTDASKEVHVLRGVTLRIEPKEVVAVVGPSGAGKSTLLHILGGLDEPTQGRVLFFGEDVYRMKERNRSQFRNERIGFIFQFYHLLPELSLLEN